MRKVGLRWVIAIIVFTLMICSIPAAAESESIASSLILGDADGDGGVTILDATTIQRYLAAYTVKDPERVKKCGDINGGGVDILDATLIQRYLASFTVPYAINEPIEQPTEPVDDTFSVTFYDYDGATVLKTQEVSNGEDAVPPVNPTKAGATFLGWSGNYFNVTQNETVKAIYSDEKNVIIAESTEGSIGNTVTVLLSIDGVVKTSGFDLTVFYDPDLELVTYDDDLDLDVLVNTDRYENGVKLNFSSASDKTRQRDIVELTFRIKNTTQKHLPITITVNSMKELDDMIYINAPYAVINGYVTVQ